MAVTYGFFNSIKGDRRYDAPQISSIFDGIIRDGVFMHYGGRFVVTPQTGMNIKVDSGRCWFNHTWTLNDNFLILAVEQSEISLKRIDTVVIEVNALEDETVENNRTCRIHILKGTPSVNPVRPTLVKADGIYQYPLADISINAGQTAISQSNITNRIGSSDTPYVTGPLELMDIDELIAQWKSQWNDYNTSVQNAWNTYFSNTQSQWTTYYNGVVDQWNAKFSEIGSTWNTFYSGVQTEWATFVETKNSEFQENINQLNYDFMRWFNDLRDVIDDEPAIKLQNQIDDLKTVRTGILLADVQGNAHWIPPSDSSSGPPWIQEIYMPGVKSTDKPLIVLNADPSSKADKKQYLKQWGFIDKVETTTDGFIFTCKFDRPSIDIPFLAKGV